MRGKGPIPIWVFVVLGVLLTLGECALRNHGDTIVEAARRLIALD